MPELPPAPAPRTPWPPVRPPSPAVPWWLLLGVFLPALIAYAYDLRDAEGFRFAHPGALVLLPLSLALIGVVVFARRRDRSARLVHARASELGAQKRGLVARVRDLPTALRLLAVALLAFALARPQSTHIDQDLELEGIDIVVALDVSGSMEETDLAPNRLDAAKMVIQNFVRRRRSDRVGLVIFGREAYTHIPLTLDHATYLRMLAELYVGIIDGKGTAIGNGVGVALNRLRRSEARSKVIILLTDGDNNAGNISPTQAAEIAQKMGIKIYTILAGANDSSDAPAGNGPRQRYPVNPKLLEQMATVTGGNPYLATDTRALAQRFESILQELEKSRLQDRGILYAELYPRFLWPAFALLVIELAMRLSRWRRLP